MIDGVQRPIVNLGSTKQKEESSNKQWEFVPVASLHVRLFAVQPVLWKHLRWKQDGNRVVGGDIIGTVQVNDILTHHVMLPPNAEGIVTWLAKKGEYSTKVRIYRQQAIILTSVRNAFSNYKTKTDSKNSTF